MATATKEHNRYGILSAAFVVMFFVASIALFSVFLTPLSEQNGWSKTDVSLSYSIFQTVMAVTGIFSGRISDKFGPRKVMLVGGLVFGLGWFLTGMATSIPMLYICHGVIAGMGNGLVYNPTLTTAQRWFPDIRGKASGILLADSRRDVLDHHHIGLAVRLSGAGRVPSEGLESAYSRNLCRQCRRRRL